MSTSKSNVTPIQTINELVVSIHKKWQRVDDAIDKAKSARLEAALELRQLKERIEAGEEGDNAAIDWWDWYGDHFRRSRSDAEKLLAIAGAEVPQDALNKRREQGRADVSNYRERQKQKLQVVEGGNQGVPPYKADVRQPDAPAAPLLPVNDVEPPKLTEAEKQTIEQIADLFESLSWTGRRGAIKRINAMYREWHG